MAQPDSYRSEDLVEVRYCPLVHPGDESWLAKCSNQCQWWNVDYGDCALNLIARGLEGIRAQLLMRQQ